MLTAAAMLTFVSSVQAVTLCTSQGEAAGQCKGQQGIAVDNATGNVYVVERNNHRVSVFASSGTFLFAFGWDVTPGGATGFEKCTTASGCKAGSSGSGAGQFSNPSRIAIDNTGGAEQGKVYVGTDNLRVQKFEADGSYELGFTSSGACQINGAQNPIAIGPGGEVFMADSLLVSPSPQQVFMNHIHHFDDNGNCVESVPLPGDRRINRAIAVDSEGNSYVAPPVVNSLVKYAPDGTELYSRDPGLPITALAVDAADNVYAHETEVSRPTGGSILAIAAYDSAGNGLGRFGYDQLDEFSTGLAVEPSGTGLFVDQSDGVELIEFPPLGPIVPPSSVEVTKVASVKAVTMAEVNPEGKAAEVFAEYVDDEHFQTEGGFASPQTKTSEPVSVEAGFSLQLAELTIGCAEATQQLIEEGKCLEPLTEYHFRVRATNADGDAEVVVGTPFTTKEPIGVEELWSSAVGTTTTTLGASVNPFGIPAEGHFEYVAEPTYQESGFSEAIRVPDPEAGQDPIDFGAAEAPAARTVPIFDLAPGTAYRYRLVASNPFLEEPQASEAGSFKTFAKTEAQAPCANDALRVGAAAFLPDCRAYELVSPLDKEGGDITVLKTVSTAVPAVLNRSSLSGEGLAYGSYRAFGEVKSAPYTSQYVARRGAGGWSSDAISPPQGRTVLSTLRRFDTGFRVFSAELCDGWLGTVAEPPLAAGAPAGYVNLYRQQLGCDGAAGYEALSTGTPQNVNGGASVIEPQGVSEDGTRAVLVAADNLVGPGVVGLPAPPQPLECTEKANGLGCMRRVYEHVRGLGLRYVCVLPGEVVHAGSCTAGFNTAQESGSNRNANLQNAVSADGSTIFWTDRKGAGKIYARLAGGETVPVSEAAEALTGGGTLSVFWMAAEDGSRALLTVDGDLYEFELAGATTTKIAGGVLGLLGASEDASKVYLVSSEVLAPGGEAGQRNLYFHDAASAGAFRYLGTLSADDLNAWHIEPVQHNSYVSADGMSAAFMSIVPLTGYDNTDAVSGEADAEVFLYDAGAEGGAGALSCVSCNPSGARPLGREDAFGDWISAQLPVWQNSLNKSRLLADDGSRLYFESFDSLVARDTNGRADVYQWEKPGTGTCEQESPAFVPSAKGCVELISSGQSLIDAGFVEASPNGEDVFFATLSSLLPQDYGLADIYDARVGGGIPYTPPVDEDCEGESCQSPPPPPPLTTPAAVTYQGPGDQRAARRKPRRCPQGKRRAKREGKVRCVNGKRKQAKRKRAVHKRRSRR